MCNLNKKAREVFACDTGAEIYGRIITTVEKHNMKEHVNKGVLLGFSGGADSVMLLLFLLEYRRRSNEEFKILCVHVNHKIRGEEADRDEAFSRDTVASSNAEYVSVTVDVPALAQSEGLGTEEAARNARYSAFRNIISGRNDISCIAVAHNSTDNAETVIFNMLRGSGLSGLCGIKPVRDEIVRPLISVSKREIVSLLDRFGISYVTDSTNLSSLYSRNYIRNEILPLFSRITPDPEAAISRMTENLLMDLSHLNEEAATFVNDYEKHGYLSSNILSELSPSVFARIISALTFKACGVYPEEKHISSIRSLLNDKNNFTFSMPGKCNFSCERGKCVFIEKKHENTYRSVIFPLNSGENKINGTNLVVYVGDVEDSLIKVYKFSIKAQISSAIIDNGIFLRFKNDGDSYRYSGITHKLKKVFNDRNIPPRERDFIPIIADEEGILWVPGLSVRDGAAEKNTEKNTTVTLCYDKETEEKITMYTALNRV